jgi:hypothetical protein
MEFGVIVAGKEKINELSSYKALLASQYKGHCAKKSNIKADIRMN